MSAAPVRHRVKYTQAMAKDAVRVFVWRRVVVAEKGLWTVAALLLALVLFHVARGDRDWWIGALGVVVLLPPLLLVAVWRAHYRNTVGRFRAMPVPEAVFVFDEDALAIESGAGSTRIPWSGLSEVWERADYWMMFTGSAQFFTLPIADLSEGDLAWLRARLQAARSAQAPSD